MLSVVIPTIGRSTVGYAVESVVSQGLRCIVINDGVDMPPLPDSSLLTYVKLGRNFGRLDGELWYGQVAFTAGAFLSDTEFTMALGDDDELIPGASRQMQSALAAQPDNDIWIPGIQYSTGGVACVTAGQLRVGNVSHTIYRTKILGYRPMYNRRGEHTGHHDFHHVERCVQDGWKIAWLGFPCVLIRPKLPGLQGCGQHDQPSV